MGHVYVVGTCDTKLEELSYVKQLIENTGLSAVLVDVGTKNSSVGDDVCASEVAAYHPEGGDEILGSNDRGAAVTAMSEALARFLVSRSDIDGVIGLGGSGGTALVTRGMRELPIGVPKLMVSTVASGNVEPYVGPNDICMMYSVTDVAGINLISRQVLANAAHAIAGMAMHNAPQPTLEEKPALGLTMFGVTTPCVTAITQALKDTYNCLVFHATGTGGRSMEKLADSCMLAGVIDITTTEVCDLLMGGVFSAGEDRLGAIARSKLPYVGSCGALDMVNFGSIDTVPEKYKDRKLYVHNPQVTLMRTSPEENTRLGEWIGAKLNTCEGEVRFLIPEGGVSLIDALDMPFFDPAADSALFEALEKTIEQTSNRKLIRLPYNINDPEFAATAVTTFQELTV